MGSRGGCAEAFAPPPSYAAGPLCRDPFDGGGPACLLNVVRAVTPCMPCSRQLRRELPLAAAASALLDLFMLVVGWATSVGPRTSAVWVDGLQIPSCSHSQTLPGHRACGCVCVCVCAPCLTGSLSLLVYCLLHANARPGRHSFEQAPEGGACIASFLSFKPSIQGYPLAIFYPWP